MRVAKVLAALVLAAAAWTVTASLAFLAATGLLGRFDHPLYQWWTYLVFARGNPLVATSLKISAGIATAAVAVFAIALAVLGRRRIGPSLRPRLVGGPSGPMRGATDNHGHADWLSLRQAQSLFPGPNADYGGIVVGEAYRVDHDPVARMPFDPSHRPSWGQGGQAPLLIDPCETGPTHSLVFAGPGAFKSMCAVSTILTWRGSVVVLDPAGELGDMLAAAREDMGHDVHRLDLRSGAGFNVLDWIDTGSPMAPTNVLSVVGWVCGDGARTGRDAGSEFFEARGRAMVACLLAHMLWDPALDPALKTLATLRRGLSTPEPEMREVLRGIHAGSASPLARDYAGTLMGLVDETFSGVYANADEATSWLANPAFAAIVCGDDFKARDLLGGAVSVFLQIPLGALQTTPAVGRVVIGALLNVAYEAEGALRGRILYLLDEAARLGPMKIIETARDAGRKFGITLQLLYQSVGQLEQQWGREGKKAWYDGVSHRSYAAVQDPDTARELEEAFGTYGVMATSEGANTGSSGKSFEAGTRSRGTTTNYHEISRPLIRRDELMHDIRLDEAFIIVRAARPLRCGRAIYFRRPELVARVQASRFNSRAAE